MLESACFMRSSLHRVSKIKIEIIIRIIMSKYLSSSSQFKSVTRCLHVLCLIKNITYPVQILNEYHSKKSNKCLENENYQVTCISLVGYLFFACTHEQIKKKDNLFPLNKIRN